MKLTQEVKAFAMEQAGRRCECTGNNCRHHLKGSRCKHGLRGDQWRVFWRKEDGGLTRQNIEAWCLDCFGNNFEVPHETVTLFSPHIVGHRHLKEENHRRAVTLKSLLHDVAGRAAHEHRGRVVLARFDDDVLLEFPASHDAVQAASGLCSGVREIAGRLDLQIPELCGAIHCGEVTRWRSGMLVGDAVEITFSARRLAGPGQVVLTGSAAAPLSGSVELEQIAEDSASELPPVGGIWALRL